MAEITQLRSTKLDVEDLFTVELDEWDMQALVNILSKIEPSYSDYAQPYTNRHVEKSLIASLLNRARSLDITPNV